MKTKLSSKPERPAVLRIRLGAYEIGSMTQLGGFDKNLFAFTQDYLKDPARPVLSLSYLDATGNLRVTEELTRSKIPPFFSNLLPEGALRDFIAKRAGINSEHEFMFLWTLGADLPGNVFAEDTEGRALPDLDVGIGSEKDDQVERNKILRFSLAGVQLKFSATGIAGKRLTIPVNGVGGHWIVKLPSPSHTSLPQNEYAMMRYAKEIGIDVPDFGLISTSSVEGLPEAFAKDPSEAYYIKRFDRTDDGGRIHIEDFNQVFGQFPRDKYDHKSYGTIAANIWRLLQEADTQEFVRRLVFSIGIGNMDMHLKNWSIIYYDGRTPRLTPAYDLVSTIVYPNTDPRLALSVSGTKVTQKIDQERLLDFARKSGIPSGLLLDTAKQTVERMQEIWPSLSKELPLSKQMLDRITAQMHSVPLFNTNSGVAVARHQPTAHSESQPTPKAAEQ